MQGLEMSAELNAEVTIRGIMARAADRGVTLSRDEVIEELKFREDDDTSIWSATVDRMMGIRT